MEAVVNAIYGHGNPTMQMHTQPVATQRFRYRMDGIRYLKGSRHHPMSIDVVSSCFN